MLHIRDFFTFITVLNYNNNLARVGKITTIDGKNHLIPSYHFGKNIMLFPYKNISGDTLNDWLQRGINYLLIYDLVQDQSDLYGEKCWIILFYSVRTNYIQY